MSRCPNHRIKPPAGRPVYESVSSSRRSDRLRRARPCQASLCPRSRQGCCLARSKDREHSTRARLGLRQTTAESPGKSKCQPPSRAAKCAGTSLCCSATRTAGWCGIRYGACYAGVEGHSVRDGLPRSGPPEHVREANPGCLYRRRPRRSQSRLPGRPDRDTPIETATAQQLELDQNAG
jgi:hypothetical protein